MFIRSSAAINDCLIALDNISFMLKEAPSNAPAGLKIGLKTGGHYFYGYSSEESRDKAYDELCKFLNCNYKLRDFT